MIARLVIALIPLSLLAVFFPCITGTHFLAGFDFTGYWYPFLAHAQEWFGRAGTLPFWIPQVFCGIPLGESLGPALYYPTEIIAWVFHVPPRAFYLWDTLAHLLLAGAGAAALARSLGLALPASAVSGLAYMLGGVLMVQVRVGIPVSVRCAALIPWILAAFVRPEAGRNGRKTALVAVMFALMLLTGGYQLLAYTLIVLAVLLLSRPGRINSLETAGAALVFAGFLSAVILLPNARYYLASMRAGSGADWGSIAPLHFADIPLLLLPWFRKVMDPERIKYLGLTVMALALVGARREWRNMRVWFGILALAFILALGSQTPAGKVVSAIPILGGFRVPMKWMLFAQLSLALFAGAGASTLAGITGRQGKVLALVLPLLVAGDLVGWELRLRKMEPVAPPVEGALEKRLLAEKGLFRVESMEPAPAINSRIQSGIEWVSGYHTAPLSRFVAIYTGASSLGTLPAILPWMNARYLVANSARQAGDRYLPRQRIGEADPVFGKFAEYVLCEDGDFAPRAWMARRIVEATSLGETLSLLAKYPPATGLVVLNSPSDNPPPRRPAGGTAKFTSRTPNKVEITVQAPAETLLVLADSFYPAWEARVDGRRQPILLANWIFRAVRVPAGKHSVVFTWNSVVFNAGLWMSLLAWTVLAGLLFRKKEA